MKMIPIAFQILVALTILNVWILRRGRMTPFRGGEAKNMREEFAAYGLPFWFMCLIGAIKVSLALALLTGIWIPEVAHYAAAGMGLLMLGAFAMHLKVKDPLLKALPSIALLALCVGILLL